MKAFGAYLVKDLDSGKVYVGSTLDYSRRRNDHELALSKGKHHNRNLQALYNAENSDFCFIRVPAKTREEAYELEQQLIDQYDAAGTLLNHSTQARHATLGYQYTEESLERMRQGQQGRRHTEETKEKIGAVHRGKVLSTDVREKISSTLRAQARSVVADGITYDSVSLCAAALGITVQTVYVRCRSQEPKFSDWHY